MRKLRRALWKLLGGRGRTTTNRARTSAPRTPRRRRRSSQKTISDRFRTTTGPALKSALRFVPYAIIALAAASLPLFGYELYVDLMTSPHLALQKVEVVGCERLDVELVTRTANVEIGENLLQIDGDAIAERLRWHPWVRKVTVSKELPDTLRIELEERTAEAIVIEERSFLVDGDGNLFKEMTADEFDKGLLIIAGLEASRLVEAGEGERLRTTLTEILAVEKEYRTLGLDGYYEIQEAHYDEVFGLTLVAPGRERFVLGNGDYPAKLRRLGEVLAHLAKNKSGVEEIRLDNEKHPWKVAVAGSAIEFEAARAYTSVPAANVEMLP